MTTPYIPPVRVLEAQYINGTKDIMHRVQLWLGEGEDPLVVWMSIVEWRKWCTIAHNRPERVPELARIRQGMLAA